MIFLANCYFTIIITVSYLFYNLVCRQYKTDEKIRVYSGFYEIKQDARNDVRYIGKWKKAESCRILLCQYSKGRTGVQL